MRKVLTLLMTCISVINLIAQDITVPEKGPFDGIDQTWQNGSDRRIPPCLANGNILCPV